MTYTSVGFGFFVSAAVVLYYLFPVSLRWVVLFAASVAFYFLAYRTGWWILLAQIVLTWLAGLWIERAGRYKKAVFRSVLFCSLLPWFCMKNGNFILGSFFKRAPVSWIVPLGISFYTLQMVSFLADIYTGKIRAQRNPFRYALFILFFPQIVQGPIPRYGDLSGQLYEGHLFDGQKFSAGFQQILWGFFLKFMIADKAAVVVNAIFDHSGQYRGFYVLVAGTLYSIELYADFMACTRICMGVAGLFGIRLKDNFMRPYLAVSIRDFWRRWHISFSSWLRDYIYIPLGGSRKGRLSKCVNLLITFAVSGIWHGAGYKYLFWGLLHALYQIVGSLTAGFGERIYAFLKIGEDSAFGRWLRRACVFLLVMPAWIIFRADSLRGGIGMVKSMFTVFNPWILFNDSLLAFGLGWKEWCVLLASVGVLLYVGISQEKGAQPGGAILRLPFYMRSIFYIGVILVIMIFGTYGFGFDAQAFIYRGF